MSATLKIPHLNDPLLDQRGSVSRIWRAFFDDLALVATLESSGSDDIAQLVASVESRGQQLLALQLSQQSALSDLQQIVAHVISQESSLMGKLETISRRIADMEQMLAASTSVS
jgi:hypothetical protein